MRTLMLTIGTVLFNTVMAQVVYPLSLNRYAAAAAIFISYGIAAYVFGASRPRP